MVNIVVKILFFYIKRDNIREKERGFIIFVYGAEGLASKIFRIGGACDKKNVPASANDSRSRYILLI